MIVELFGNFGGGIDILGTIHDWIDELDIGGGTVKFGATTEKSKLNFNLKTKA